jgi:DNA-binding CsgD family transcriptional regulator
MTVSTLTSDATALAATAPMILPRLARSHVNALGAESGSIRLVVIGTAGSGKTRLLRHVLARLTAQGLEAIAATSASDLADAPAERVVIVDDAHLADAELLRAVAGRAEDPTASLVVAARPWHLTAPLAPIAAELERAQPAIVLGSLSADDVLEHFDETGRIIDRGCLDDILEATGHLSWLVSEALVVHDDLGCRGGPHPGIGESLRDLIARRVDTLDPEVRDGIVATCLASSAGAAMATSESTMLAGYATGLLQRNGRPAPIVADAVRATVSVERLLEKYAAAFETSSDPVSDELVEGLHDERIADALLAGGDEVLPRDPRRAAELYRAAGDAGSPYPVVALRLARGAWATGEVDEAGSLLDELAADGEATQSAAAAITRAAVWAARGDLTLSDATFADRRIETAEEVAHATIAAVGAADSDSLDRLASITPARTLPATLAVSLDLLTRGMRSSLGTATVDTLGSLVRASEMYSASGTLGPIAELPGVLAALTAVNMGDLTAAQTVLDDAVRAHQAGGWAQSRLRLWQAWVMLQRDLPAEARVALQRSGAAPGPQSARDRLLTDAVAVALARRYGDSASLAPAWNRARASILRAQFDLYTLHPLAEFAVTAAGAGEFERVRPHLDGAFAALARLGEPPLWSAHLHWAGFHAGILRNEPEALLPHTRALELASARSRPAERMAQAARAWTEVLAGTVDADSIEVAALGLAEAGLAWDGVRLAGYAAGRSTDRRVTGRLLACARQLNPRERSLRAEEFPAPADATPAARGAATGVLSAREREVAALVLQGKTYAEIGDSIFISPRTAEHHIARIRRRLGATSRSDLVAKLRIVMNDPPQERP